MMNECKIINLTPHKLVFFLSSNLSEKIEVESQGTIRVSEQRVRVGDVCGIPVNRKTYTDINQENIKMIKKYVDDPEVVAVVVSVIVANKLKEIGFTDKIYIPDDLVRDEKGFVIGCRSLAKV